MLNKEAIISGEAVLGIEFGSTRIKAVLIGENDAPIATGCYDWENRLENGIWTYSVDEIKAGLKGAYADLKKNVAGQYGVEIKNLKAIGISGMMHGYLPFDENNRLLTAFRTWRNTTTGEAADKLTDAFGFNIPQRWSIAHLYQAILSGEEHVNEIRFFTTLAGYVHWLLTGERVLGVGEASGLFPIGADGNYDSEKAEIFNELIKDKGFSWKIQDIMPRVLTAGENAGTLTENGARLLDADGCLSAGIPLCPPEGDAGTGMVATNSVRVRTGNVSAGTSVFLMLVLEKELKKLHREVDMVTTPSGEPVAMIHCNNCTSDINAWAGLFKEFADTMGIELSMGDIFTSLFKKSAEADADCGGLLSYNYLSGEHITGFESGKPLFVREPDSRFTLANFMRVQLFTAFGALKTGLDIIRKEEEIPVDKILGHGGFFKTPEIGQRVLAAVVNAPVSVMETAGEGGAWGVAVLASYMMNKADGESLADYLDNKVFSAQRVLTVEPDAEEIKAFDMFMKSYAAGLKLERAALYLSL